MTRSFLFAGFGGQGVLFAGKVLAYAGLCEGYFVTWLPSYGPETRGGTSNCSVVISDREIGSPLVTQPDVFIALNRPSYDKLIDSVTSGGAVIMDSTLVGRESERGDIVSHSVQATALAGQAELEGLSNMILLGKLFKETGLFGDETIKQAVEKSVSEKRKDLVASNLRAIELGKKQ